MFVEGFLPRNKEAKRLGINSDVHINTFKFRSYVHSTNFPAPYSLKIVFLIKISMNEKRGPL